MYKATLYFSDGDNGTVKAARARVVELGIDVGFATATATVTRTIGVWDK